jgi:hypothetical protein
MMSSLISVVFASIGLGVDAVQEFLSGFMCRDFSDLMPRIRAGDVGDLVARVGYKLWLIAVSAIG